MNRASKTFRPTIEIKTKNKTELYRSKVAYAVQSPIAKAEIEYIRNSWASLGISMEPKFILDWARFHEYVGSDAVQMYRYAWFVDMPDPDNIFQALFGSGSKVNYMRFRSGSVDHMLGLGRKTFRPMERQVIYQDIEDQVLMDQPLIPLVHLSIDHVYQASVHGVVLSALGDHLTRFHRVWLDRSGRTKQLASTNQGLWSQRQELSACGE